MAKNTPEISNSLRRLKTSCILRLLFFPPPELLMVGILGTANSGNVIDDIPLTAKLPKANIPTLVNNIPVVIIKLTVKGRNHTGIGIFCTNNVV